MLLFLCCLWKRAYTIEIIMDILNLPFTTVGLSYPYPYRKHGLLYRLRKWPTTMAILVLTELALIYRIDSESLVDLHQYIGTEDFARDDEKLYN